MSERSFAERVQDILALPVDDEQLAVHEVAEAGQNSDGRTNAAWDAQWNQMWPAQWGQR